ncbi:hypothetical protein H9P43_006332 [Blastocladiella emersonii ATCC 22665]|nr:hypothetical protein H9P43_006332 [Blastocladiella emersonii ATCC 22665]
MITSLFTGPERPNRNLVTDVIIRASRSTFGAMDMAHMREIFSAFSKLSKRPVELLLFRDTAVTEFSWQVDLRAPSDTPAPATVTADTNGSVRLVLESNLLTTYPRVPDVCSWIVRADWVVPPVVDSDRVVLFRIPASRIVLMGDSAGANLALSTTIFLREQGHPLPSAIVCISPWTDLPLQTPSTIENQFDLLVTPAESVLGRHAVETWDYYVGRDHFGAKEAKRIASTHPMISPCRDRGSTRAPWPPVYLCTGTDEKLLDDNIYFAANLARLSDLGRASFVVHDVFIHQPHCFPLVLIGHNDTRRVHQRVFSFLTEIADAPGSRPPFRVETCLFDDGRLLTRDATRVWGPRWTGLARTNGVEWTPNYARASGGQVLSDPPKLDTSATEAEVEQCPPLMTKEDEERIARLRQRSLADLKKAVAAVQRTSSVRLRRTKSRILAPPPVPPKA